MKNTNADGFELYQFIEDRVKNRSKETPITVDIKGIRDHIETIRECNNIVTAVSRLLMEFQVDDECGNEIPAELKTGTIRGGLYDALKMAAYNSEVSAEYLQEQFKEGDNAKQ
jgi:hypothetical protein